jgi:predicted TIM-barrel fold metal-dependent hydrolase
MISIDSHMSPKVSDYADYMDPKYRPYLADFEAEDREYTRRVGIHCTHPDHVLDLIDRGDAIRSGGAYGWDLDRRLAEMDREGIAGEFLIPVTQFAAVPFFSNGNRPWAAELRAAGATAYHRLVADFMSGSDGRMIGIAECGPCLDLDETVRSLHWLAAHGYKSVLLPGMTGDPALPPLFDAHFERFWATCEELGLVLCAHAGYGKEQGFFYDFLDRLAAKLGNEPKPEDLLRAVQSDEEEGSPFVLDLKPRQALWELLLGGVFDRHPNLRLAFTEVRADWVPATLRYLDARFEAGGTPLTRSPSEYWRSNCWAGNSSMKKSEVELRYEIGVDKMMFGRDYPHPEGTWPNTLEWLQAAMAGLPVEEIKAIVGANAIECYDLDAAKFTAIADRIAAPELEDISNPPQPVQGAVIENFDARGGFLRSEADVDVDALATACLESETRLAQSR